jgi:membrane fusion protein, heavy metal efflux system
MGKQARFQTPARVKTLRAWTAVIALGAAWPLVVHGQAGKPAPAPVTTAPAAASPPAAAARSAARPTVGCLIGPEVVADIGSPVTALVAVVAVDRGDSVRAGQTLVQLESEVERNSMEAARSRAAMDADILAAEANMALARQRHVRAVELVGQGFTSPQTLEQAKAELDVAEQKLRQARSQKAVNAHELGLVKAQLNQRTLKSPFNGVVIERFVSPGERAEDKPLLRLAMLNPLRVELVMPATRWGSVSVGDKMPIVPELPAASAVTAQVTHIDKIIDAASNTFRVRLSLPNPGNRLPAGARCRLDGAEGGVAAAAVPAPGAARLAPAGVVLPATSPASLSLPAGVKPVLPAPTRPPV